MCIKTQSYTTMDLSKSVVTIFIERITYMILCIISVVYYPITNYCISVPFPLFSCLLLVVVVVGNFKFSCFCALLCVRAKSSQIFTKNIKMAAAYKRNFAFEANIYRWTAPHMHQNLQQKQQNNFCTKNINRVDMAAAVGRQNNPGEEVILYLFLRINLPVNILFKFITVYCSFMNIN
jgi:hypothetical protein